MALRARVLCAALLAALATPATAAEVVVWNSNGPDERAAFDRLVEAYNARKGAAEPHVRVVPVSFDGGADRFTAAVPRGKGPDVFIYAQDRLGGWVDAGILAPLDPFLDPATRERFVPTALQAMTYRGGTYGLPLDFKVITLIHNRRLVRTPPRTTAELAAVARRLTHRATGQYGLVYLYDDFYYHAALQNGFGGRVFDERAQPVLDSAANLHALQLLLRWRDDFLPETPVSRAQMNALFNAGKAAMIFEGPWFRGVVSRDIDYGVAPLPVISEAGDQPMRPWVSVEGLYLVARSPLKHAAYDFMRYVTDLDAAKVMALEGTHLPANARAYLDPALVSDEVLSAFFRQVRVAEPMPNLAEMTSFWSPGAIALGTALRHDATPEAALARAQASVLKALAARRP